MPAESLRKIDSAMQRVFGLGYLRLTRDSSIHERLRYLVDRVNEAPGDGGLSVLDAGCGAGMALRYLAAFAPRVTSYRGIDLRAGRLESRYRHIQLAHDFLDIDIDHDWDVGTFDFVWCAETLEHLMDDAGALKKLARAAKPGGTIAVTMPSLPYVEAAMAHVPALRVLSESQDGGHVRHGYDIARVERLAADAGLRVERIDSVSRMSVWRTRARYRVSPLIANLAGMSANVPASRETLPHYASIAAVLRK